MDQRQKKPNEGGMSAEYGLGGNKGKDNAELSEQKTANRCCCKPRRDNNEKRTKRFFSTKRKCLNCGEMLNCLSRDWIALCLTSDSSYTFNNITQPVQSLSSLECTYFF